MIGRQMKKLATFVASALLVLAILLPGAASAQSSTCQAYNPQTCGVTTTTSTSPTGTVSSVTTSTLPFTGLDIALLVAGGVVLMGAGFLVRVASRRLSD
jgi:hypothetical protein